MAHVARTPLGAATSPKKWYLDVNTGTYAVPVWIAVNGVTNFVPKQDPTLQDDSDFDSDGSKSQAKTALQFGADVTVGRKVTAASATVYDPGQEALRTASRTLGTGGIVDVRYYEVTSGGPTAEAYRGYAEVSWVPAGGAMDALEGASITLTGRGNWASITHPDNEAAHVPVVSTITPATAAAAGGQVVSLYGQYFTGVTACKVGAGGTAFTSYYKIDDNHIIGELPAKTAGTYVIEVTNATGASTGGATVTYS
jgi:hypothetical protein